MKKLILFCLMLISGLTQAQEFDFSCEPDEEFTYTYNIEIGSGDHTHTLTASNTVTTNDIFELEFTIPNGYKINKSIGANSIYVGSDWSVKRGALTEGASSFKVSVKPPSVLIDGSGSLDLGTYISAEEVDFKVTIDISNTDSMIASTTIIGLNPGSIDMSIEIPAGYYIKKTFNGSPFVSGDYTMNVTTLNEGGSFIDFTMDLPDVLNYDNDIALTFTLGLPYIDEVEPYGDYIATINGEAIGVMEGEPETFVMTDGSEAYQGAMKIVVEGPNFPSKTFVIDYPGSTTTYLEGTPFHIQIPLKCCNSDFEPSNYQQWLLKIIVNDNLFSDYEAGDWSATYSKAVPGVDFSIDSNSIEVPTPNANQVIIAWSIAGEDDVVYQTVPFSKGDYSYKGSYDLPTGITTTDHQGLYFNTSDNSEARLHFDESYDGATFAEWRLAILGDFDGQAQINVILTASALQQDVATNTMSDWFYGLTDEVHPLSIIGTDGYDQLLNGVLADNVIHGADSDILEIASGEDAYITIPGYYGVITLGHDEFGNLITTPSEELQKYHIGGNYPDLGFGVLSSSDEEFKIYFQFTNVSGPNDFIFTVHNND